MAWHTINDTGSEFGKQLIAAADRLDRVAAVGMDEHNVMRGTFNSPTVWGTAIVDLGCGRLLGLVPQRPSTAASGWFAPRGAGWCGRVTEAALDPYEGYPTALSTTLPNTTLMVDHFHLVRLGNQGVDEVRGRVQQQTLGDSAAKRDPLYGIRKLLLVTAERLDRRTHDGI